jgi:hypothetical protein
MEAASIEKDDYHGVAGNIMFGHVAPPMGTGSCLTFTCPLAAMPGWDQHAFRADAAAFSPLSVNNNATLGRTRR